MNVKIDNLITVLDAGSSKSCVLVAELIDGVLRYRGHGVEASKGMRRGVISDLGPAAKAINDAALTAEKSAKAPMETVVVGIGGPHVRGMNSQGGISMGSRMKEITREDVRSAIDRARGVGLAPDREVLHLLPQQFILHDQGGAHDTGGVGGERRVARCCSVFPNSSFLMIKAGFMIRWGWWGTGWRFVCISRHARVR